MSARGTSTGPAPDLGEAQRRLDELVLASASGEKVSDLEVAKAAAAVTVAERRPEAEARAAAVAEEEARRVRVDDAVARLRSDAPPVTVRLLDARRAALEALHGLVRAAEAYQALVGGTARLLAVEGRRGPLPAGVRDHQGGVDDGPVYWPCPADLVVAVAGQAVVAAVARAAGTSAARRALKQAVPATSVLESLQVAVDTTRTVGSPTGGGGGEV